VLNNLWKERVKRRDSINQSQSIAISMYLFYFFFAGAVLGGEGDTTLVLGLSLVQVEETLVFALLSD